MSGLVVADRRLTCAELLSHLVGQAGGGQWLDAFLLAAGAAQVVEDHADRRRAFAARGRSYLAGARGKWKAGATAFAAATAAAGRVESWSRAQQAVDAQRQPLLDLATDLAVVALGGVDDPRGGGLSGRELWGRAGALESAARSWPAPLRQALLRPPSCFTSFDVAPADVAALAADLVDRFDASAGVLVVGVRTSGSYLAPLGAAALRLLGVRSRCLTVRPGVDLPAGARAALLEGVAGGGLVWLVDDPPVTGRSVARAAAAVEAAGVPRSCLVVGMPLAGAELPAALTPWPAVSLPPERWQIRRRLHPGAVGDHLRHLLPCAGVVEVTALGPPALAPRGHSHARFALQVAAGAGSSLTEVIVAEGAGTGFFAGHAAAVSSALGPKVPEVLAVADGVVYRRWVPAAPSPPPAGERGQAVAEHVWARHRALPAAADRSLALVDQQPVWEVAARLLGAGMGPAWHATRPLLGDRVVRRLLHVERPSVTDGCTEASRWLPVDGARRLVKLDPWEGSFGHHDLACYDPVADLAGAAVGEGEEFETAALRRYADLAGSPVDRERWLLYLLAHVWDRRRRGALAAADADRLAGGAVNRYLAGLFLADMAPAGGGGTPGGPLGGPWCALDLDGVLEHDALGFPATTPAGALALRALRAHGYRPLLCSGRSAEEVGERCRIFGLGGGVAEYGAVAVLAGAHRGAEIDLLDAGAQASLDRVRTWLGQQPGVEVDPRYRRIVRARGAGAAGASAGGPLAEAVVAAALYAGALSAGAGGCSSPAPLAAVAGCRQTDIVAGGVDKGTGVLALLEALGTPGQTPALVMGDTAADLPMLALASLPLAPANATPALSAAGVPLTSRSYQAGLAQGVGRLIGHPPGACPRCRPPRFSPRTRQLLALLALAEGGGAGAARGMLRLAACQTASAVAALADRRAQHPQAVAHRVQV